MCWVAICTFEWIIYVSTLDPHTKVYLPQVVASVDDIESLCLILSDNLRERHCGMGGKANYDVYHAEMQSNVKFNEV